MSSLLVSAIVVAIVVFVHVGQRFQNKGKFLLGYGRVVLVLSNRRRIVFLFVTYTIIQSITSSEMCSLHLTHPSAHTLGAVGSRCCGARGAVGGSVPCSRVSPQSWTIPAGAEIRTHNLGLQVQRSIH